MYREMQLLHCNTFNILDFQPLCAYIREHLISDNPIYRLQLIVSPSFFDPPKSAIVVSIPSIVVLRLCPLKLMLCLLYKSYNSAHCTNIPTQLHISVRDMNVFHSHVKNIFYVFKFCFLMTTFLAYAMKSIMIYLY